MKIPVRTALATDFNFGVSASVADVCNVNGGYFWNILYVRGKKTWRGWENVAANHSFTSGAASPSSGMSPVPGPALIPIYCQYLIQSRVSHAPEILSENLLTQGQTRVETWEMCRYDNQWIVVMMMINTCVPRWNTWGLPEHTPSYSGEYLVQFHPHEVH